MNIRTWSASIGTVLAAAGCATPDQPARAPAEARAVVFRCDRGETLLVRFLPDRRAAVLVRNGQSMELPQQPSGSGFLYSSGIHTLRGKGEDLTVEIGRMAPLQCRAQ